MFTGIIQSVGHVVNVTHEPGLTRFSVSLPADMVESLKIGASVAVNGVCLTVTSIAPLPSSSSSFSSVGIGFDVMRETLDLTTLGFLKPSDKVNVERSLKVGDELGGHLVSGHVHGVAKIVDIKKSENNVDITFEPPVELNKYIFPKGFIALNGVSLTVIGDNNVSENLLGGNPTPNLTKRCYQRCKFVVSLIPSTLSATTFSSAKIGDLINIEVDQQTRTIVDTISILMRG